MGGLESEQLPAESWWKLQYNEWESIYYSAEKLNSRIIPLPRDFEVNSDRIEQVGCLDIPLSKVLSMRCLGLLGRPEGDTQQAKWLHSYTRTSWPTAYSGIHVGSGGNVSKLYSSDAWFESRPEHRISWRMFCFPRFLQSRQANSGTVPWRNPLSFLRHPFNSSFSNHLNIWRFMIWGTDSVVKWTIYFPISYTFGDAYEGRTPDDIAPKLFSLLHKVTPKMKVMFSCKSIKGSNNANMSFLVF